MDVECLTARVCCLFELAIADDAPRTDNVGDDIDPKVVREGLDHDFAS